MDSSRQIIEILAANEEKIMQLYEIFSLKFPADGQLWSGLSHDEMIHAAMIKNLGEMTFKTDISFDAGKFSLERLEKIGAHLDREIKKAANDGFSRKSALKLALGFEKTLLAAKLFETFDSEVDDMKKLFGLLKSDTLRHACAIKDYRII